MQRITALELKPRFFLEYKTRAFACTITCIGHSAIYFKISNEHNHVHCMHFLFQNDRFILLSMTNEIVKILTVLKQTSAEIPIFVTLSFDPFKLNKL